jgi:hypothetical protein
LHAIIIHGYKFLFCFSIFKNHGYILNSVLWIVFLDYGYQPGSLMNYCSCFFYNWLALVLCFWDTTKFALFSSLLKKIVVFYFLFLIWKIKLWFN